MTTQFSLESLAAKFVSRIAKSSNEDLATIAFSSPLSARSPDLCMLWHPVYFSKHRFKLFFHYAGSAFLELPKLTLKRLWKKDFFSYALYGTINRNLLILPSHCGSENKDGKYRTPYVRMTDNEAILIFGPENSCGTNEIKISVFSTSQKTRLTFLLIRKGLDAAWSIKNNPLDSLILFFCWFHWITQMEWLNILSLEKTLNETVKKHKIEKIGCIHEMHSYARAIWQVTKKNNLPSFTVQHATISEGKRWYFPYPDEILNGLAAPTLMYVYEEKMADMLKSHFKNTNFRLGCSSRYTRWKNTLPVQTKSNGVYLYVTALAGFDNDIIFASLKKQIALAPKNISFKLRLHPNAILQKKDRQWLKENTKNKIIALSQINLFEDISHADIVIGMSTTVLEEALLLGKPVIQITHPDYLRYINLHNIPGVTMLDYHIFENTFVNTSMHEKPNTDIMKKRLGIFEEEITYSKLFS